MTEDWFLCDKDLSHERVKCDLTICNKKLLNIISYLAAPIKLYILTD